ncbi:MAG: sulfur reduction protein DsrE [Methanosarcinales archaeon]|nr:sulfur reduction protein DsrE [Methanosarcinales archaeon]
MRSMLFLVDAAPYGSEKAYGILNAALVCLPLGAAVALYGDGVYLALAGQDSRGLSVPNLGSVLYAYPELRVVAHEPSLVERGLMDRELIEKVELLDEMQFLEELEAAEAAVMM